MEYKKLGKSDVLVSELILGCWAMGGDYFGATEDKSSLEALEVSYENGVNTFDTAEIYGDGRSERVVGEAARRIGRDKVRIISKVFKPSMSHDKMIKACEDSLQRLGTDYLDVSFLHYPVAEEAVLTVEALGIQVELVYDVGVAGLHRLPSHRDSIMDARVIIAIAGMEGALASVIGGLADCPVIAVPTSIGYGASFGGVSALLSMLNSCSSGVSVVNIDNGFGAGFLADRINHIGVRP